MIVEILEKLGSTASQANRKPKKIRYISTKDLIYHLIAAHLLMEERQYKK